MVQLGAREVVAPALEQGKVDMVPEYLGSALNFLNDRDRVATADPALTHARLEQAFAPRGVSVLAYAPAQDRNGFVVTGDLARRRNLVKVSDLAPLASRLSFGGPPECPERPLCLKGLQELYKLRFARFEAMPSRAVTAAALDTGEIDVGMIETTDPNLVKADLVQLADDRRLQPADNVVPVVRREVLDVYGPQLVRLVNAVSAQLTTTELTRLNLQVLERPAGRRRRLGLAAGPHHHRLAPGQGGGDRRRVGRPEHARVGDEGGDQLGRGDVEGRVPEPAARGPPRGRRWRGPRRRALLDLDVGAGGGVRVEARPRPAT